jgi:hypothetical protein
MRHVPTASLYPGHCAVLPNVGGRDPGGYIDTGSQLDGHRIYVSRRAVVQMAAMVGWVAPAQVAQEVQRAEEAEARVAELEALLAESEAVVEAVNIVKARKQRAKEVAA